MSLLLDLESISLSGILSYLNVLVTLITYIRTPLTNLLLRVKITIQLLGPLSKTRWCRVSATTSAHKFIRHTIVAR